MKKLQEALDVAQEELNGKIFENENLHIKMFDREKEFENQQEEQLALLKSKQEEICVYNQQLEKTKNTLFTVENQYENEKAKNQKLTAKLLKLNSDFDAAKSEW